MIKKMMLTVIFVMIMLAWQLNTGQTQVVTDGLVSYWTFDKADIDGETVKDVFGNNDGTIVGEPQIVKGKVGDALEFNGASDYVEVEDDESLQLWTTHTLEAWLYQKESRSSRIIDKITAGTADGLHLDTHPGTKLRTCSGNCISTDIDYSLETWVHAIVTFNDGEVKLYINGSVEGEGEVPSPLSGNSLPLRIAADSNGQNLFLGIIDEVRIYNRVLNKTEINQNMNAEGLAVLSSYNKLAITWGKIKK